MTEPRSEATEAARAAPAGASTVPFWLDRPGAPEPAPPLVGDVTADLAIVGGGLTGLWTALLAKEADPDRSVVLLEGGRLAWAASGRNGGFCAASLTHGEENGRAHLPDEYDELDRLGRENLEEIEAALTRYGIDCGWERTGEITVATQPYQVQELSAEHDPEAGREWLDAEALAGHLRSPMFLGGLWDRRGVAMVDPARLCWGLARAAREAGVVVHEDTVVRAIDKAGPAGSTQRLRTDAGSVTARRVALATNAFPSLLKRWRHHVVPVYDYCLVTEPLTPAQLAALGWAGRQGVGDAANRFHYFRLTDDDRLLWGGWDAVYHYGGRVSARYDQREETFTTLAAQLVEMFPALEGVRFSHKWGGAIDTCTRFFPFFATARGGTIAYAAGFTGLGVGASRFAARVLLDLLSGDHTPLLDLDMVRRTPLPFPPDPVAWVGIEMTTRALARADEREGRRGVWLRLLDALGVGFDT